MCTCPTDEERTQPRWWIFKGDENPQHVFLRRDVKQSAKSRKILRHVKELFGVLKVYFASQNSSLLSPVPPVCFRMILLVGLPEISGGWIRSFRLSISFDHGSLYSFITWGLTIGPLVAAVQRRSLTPSWSSSSLLLVLCIGNIERNGKPRLREKTEQEHRTHVTCMFKKIKHIGRRKVKRVSECTPTAMTKLQSGVSQPVGCGHQGCRKTYSWRSSFFKFEKKKKKI
jgi:hypothetical protein